MIFTRGITTTKARVDCDDNGCIKYCIFLFHLHALSSFGDVANFRYNKTMQSSLQRIK